MNRILRLLFIGSFTLLFLASCGENPSTYIMPTTMFTVNSYVSDNAVFQERENVIINGQSEEGALIKGTLKKDNRTIKEFSDVVDEKDEFMLSFTAPKASLDEYQITIDDGVHTLTINNIRFGSVWVITGEDFKIKTLTSEPTEEISPKVSLYDGSKWTTNMFNQDEFSQFVLLYANKLAEKLSTPLGIISAVVDKAHIDSWLNPLTTEDNLRIKKFLTDTNRFIEIGDSYFENYDTMCSVYKQMIEPISNLSIKGIIWKQGISNLEDYLKNSGYAFNGVNYFRDYQYVLTQVFNDLYNVFGSDVDMFILQQGSSDHEYASLLREAQASATYLLKYTNVITTYGYEDDELLMNSIANAVYEYTYENHRDYLSPNYINSISGDDYIKIMFNNCSSLLIEEEYFGLKIYDQNGELIELEVVVEDNWLKVILPKPIEGEDAVKIKLIEYAQGADIDDSNLKNENGIGVVPFVIKFNIE